MTIKLQVIDEKAGYTPFSMEMPEIGADEVIARDMATPGPMPVIRTILKRLNPKGLVGGSDGLPYGVDESYIPG